MEYRFVDCRWSLDDPAAGHRDYLAGHVPGAAVLDVETALSGPAGATGRHPLPEPASFEAALRNAGVDTGTFVVAYGSLGGAERLWWLLRHHGHERCAVLDLAAWRGPLAAGEEKVATGSYRVGAARQDDTVSLAELAERHAELVVVDARLPERWRGEPNPVDRVPGRIPGALNAPWNEPLPALPDGEPVVYCGSGMTACVVLHQLHLAGREGRLYPGSWSEWAQQPELPVERS